MYTTTNFFSPYKNSSHLSQKAPGFDRSILWCVCHADLSPSCTPPSLFIRTKTCLWHLRHFSEPLHKHGKPDQFQWRQTVPALWPVSFAERQTEQTVSESMNLWVLGNWEFPYGLWWNDKILSTGLWGGQNGEIIRYPRGTCHLLDNLIIHLSLCLVEWSFWIKWGEMDCPLNVNY